MTRTTKPTTREEKDWWREYLSSEPNPGSSYEFILRLLDDADERDELRGRVAGLETVAKAAEELLRVLLEDGGYRIDDEAMAELEGIFDEPCQPQTAMLALANALDALNGEKG